MAYDESAASRGLERLLAWEDGSGGELERRHEVLLERAVARDGLDRDAAEAAYAVALEEGLEPELGLLLVAAGVGVIELAKLETDPEGIGSQQSPPEWVAEADLPEREARRERRLRLSFRRLRALLEKSDSAADALRRFADEPDVTEGAY